MTSRFGFMFDEGSLVSKSRSVQIRNAICERSNVGQDVWYVRKPLSYFLFFLKLQWTRITSGSIVTCSTVCQLPNIYYYDGIHTLHLSMTLWSTVYSNRTVLAIEFRFCAICRVLIGESKLHSFTIHFLARLI